MVAVERWSDEPAAPWERQPDDTDKSFAAFVVYRDMGSERSLAKAAEKAGQHPNNFREWAAAHGWRYRAAAYDRMLDVERVKVRVREVRQMEARHAQVAAAGLASLALPFVALQQERHLGGGLTIPRLEELRQMPTEVLVRLASRSANAMGRMAQVERISRGQPTEIIGGEVEVPVRLEQPLGDRERVEQVLAALLETGLVEVRDGRLVSGAVDAEVVGEE